MRRVLIGVALAIACFEVVLRQFYFVPWELDPDFGCIVKPGATVVYRREGVGRSRWTFHGVRRPAPLAADGKPILVLGDSFTEAYMLNDDEVFTARTEALLAERHHPIPVLNIGQSGRSAADYVADAARNAQVFAPRWIVVQLRADDLEADAWTPAKTHFSRAVDGRLQAIASDQTNPRDDFLWRLRQRSAIVNYAILRVLEFERGLDAEPPLFRAGEVHAAPPPETAASFPIGEELSALNDAYGGRVTFVFLSPFEPLDLGRRSPTEAAYDSWCLDHAASCVSLRPSFPDFARRYAAPYGFPNTGFNVGHMNAEGNAVVGRLLTDELERLLAHGLL